MSELTLQAEGQSQIAPRLKWESFADLPNSEGFAGMYAGVSNSAVIVAGGTNFPKQEDGERGAKFWSTDIYFFEPGSDSWKKAEVKLEGARAYGASVSHHDEVICVGGADESRHYADVFALRLADGQIRSRKLRPLPAPTAYLSAEVVDGVLYVAAGLERPDSCEATHVFWSLDLNASYDQQQWHQLEPWPGKPRNRSVAASAAGCFYLISGIESSCGGNEEAIWETPYLKDGFRYVPDNNRASGRWERIADLPAGAAAGPSPAITQDESQIVLLGGLNGTETYPSPGFPRRVRVYDTRNNSWSESVEMPSNASRVTAPTIKWRSGFLIVGGESGPKERSPQVQYLCTIKQREVTAPTK